MEQNDSPAGKNVGIKDIEIILWTLPGIIFLLDITYSYGLDSFIKEPAIFLDLFFAFSPLLFAVLFSVIYNNYPISHIIALIKKENVEK